MSENSNNTPRKSIYEILGIEDKKSSAPESRLNIPTFQAPETRYASDLHNAPSGSIFDNYSKYPQEQLPYWRKFRILTIVGILTCFAPFIPKVWPSSCSHTDSYTGAEDIYGSEIEEEEVIATETVPARGDALYFRGEIDNKLKIHMELDLSSGSGRYYYDKSGAGRCMYLRVVKMDELYDGYYLEIEEYNGSGEYCGVWKGAFTNGTFSGIGVFLGKSLPFFLTECDRRNTDF